MGDYWSWAKNEQRVMMSNNGDFEEGDVWSVASKGREDSTPAAAAARNSIHKSLAGSSSAWQYSTAPKTIPRRPASQETGKLRQRSSAPVNIPDWSKIYGNKRGDGLDGEHEHGHGGYSNDGDDDGDDEDDDDDGGDGDMVPPHEWVAKRLARTRISPFSVCEGVGRTLKGRELSRVRNAILTKTGFLE